MDGSALPLLSIAVAEPFFSSLRKEHIIKVRFIQSGRKHQVKNVYYTSYTHLVFRFKVPGKSSITNCFSWCQEPESDRHSRKAEGFADRAAHCCVHASSSRMLKKAIHGLFQPAKQKV
jgi:hypothetical protein